MDFVRVSKGEGIAEVALRRGKVNAINEQVVRELRECFQQLADDPGTNAIGSVLRTCLEACPRAPDADRQRRCSPRR